MIDDFCALIASKWASLQQEGTCEESALQFTKFCQRVVQPHTKVLFFVTYKGRPLCVLKVMRSPKWNDKLRNEKEAQASVTPMAHVASPVVFFDAMLDGLYVYAEQPIAKGMPISRSTAIAYEREIVELISSFPRYGEIDANVLSNLLVPYIPENEPTLPLPLETLRTSGAQLQTGFTHSDLGSPNILKDGDTLYMIDWEQAGTRPFFLLDAVYFMARARRVEGLSDWHHRCRSAFMEYTHSTATTADALFSLFVILRVLQKRHAERYSAVIAEFAKRI